MFLGFSKESNPDSEDLQDAFEDFFFALKKRFHQMFEQLLLYPKFERECQQLIEIQSALFAEIQVTLISANTLNEKLDFSLEPLEITFADPSVLMRNLKKFQHTSAQLKKELFDANYSQVLFKIISDSKNHLLEWHRLWATVPLQTIDPATVKLSQVLNAQTFYSQLEDWQQAFDVKKSSTRTEIEKSFDAYPQLVNEIFRLQLVLKKWEAQGH